VRIGKETLDAVILALPNKTEAEKDAERGPLGRLGSGS
jgi:hypothetical protein